MVKVSDLSQEQMYAGLQIQSEIRERTIEKLEAEIKNLNLKIEKLNLKIQRADNIMIDIQIEGYISEDIEKAIKKWRENK